MSVPGESPGADIAAGLARQCAVDRAGTFESRATFYIRIAGYGAIYDERAVVDSRFARISVRAAERKRTGADFG